MPLVSVLLLCGLLLSSPALAAERTGAAEISPGEKISLFHCGRCHVVNHRNRMNAIGSTPSFALMRSFADWEARFRAFYTLKPHPAFTQITDVTAPFDEKLPSPIAPVEMTLEEIETMLVFVEGIEPANLGAPLSNR